MKSRSLSALIAALLVVLILGGGAIAAFKVPKHSVGFNSLTPKMQKQWNKLMKTPGPAGPQGPMGLQGPQGKAGSDAPGYVTPYSMTMSKGDPDQTVATFGPLTFTASCENDGGATKAMLIAKSSADNVWLVGKILDSGDTTVVQELDSTLAEEDFLPIFRATDETGSFSMQGIPMLIINTLNRDCRFFGSLVNTGA